jgi:hypothetical protein
LELPPDEHRATLANRVQGADAPLRLAAPSTEAGQLGPASVSAIGSGYPDFAPLPVLDTRNVYGRRST